MMWRKKSNPKSHPFVVALTNDTEQVYGHFFHPGTLVINRNINMATMLPYVALVIETSRDGQMTFLLGDGSMMTIGAAYYINHDEKVEVFGPKLA